MNVAPHNTRITLFPRLDAVEEVEEEEEEVQEKERITTRDGKGRGVKGSCVGYPKEGEEMAASEVKERYQCESS